MSATPPIATGITQLGVPDVGAATFAVGYAPFDCPKMFINPGKKLELDPALPPDPDPCGCADVGTVPALGSVGGGDVYGNAGVVN